MEQRTDQIVRMADEIGQPTLRWQALLVRSATSLLLGEPGRAERETTEAFAIGTATGQPDAFSFYSTQLFLIRWHQHRLLELLELLDQFHSQGGRLPKQVYFAFAAVQVGRLDVAGPLLDTEKRVRFRGPQDFLLLSRWTMWAEVATRLGDQEAAALLYGHLAPWADVLVATGVTCSGAVAHYLGALAAVRGDLTAVEGHFTQALVIHERVASPFFVARTYLEWARAEVQRETRLGGAGVREKLHMARQLSERHGFPGVERHACDLLDHAGG